MNRQLFSGIWVPALTPFRPDLAVDRNAFVTHCAALLDQGVDGLAVFGTTGEANSLSLDERMTLLDDLIEAGIPAEKLMPGTGCCALPDTVRLSEHAVERGCRAVLMLPPFYYSGVGDDGLFAYFSRVIERVASERLRVFLYHIPPMTGVPISPALIGRLRDAWPSRVAGVKDSGGDWNHTRTLLERFDDLRIFAGSERFLLDTLRDGGAGCITASGNINPGGIRVVYEQWLEDVDNGDDAQCRITMIRDMLERYPMIPALKALCAVHYESEDWANVRPPLTPLTQSRRTALVDAASSIGFSIRDSRRFVTGV